MLQYLGSQLPMASFVTQALVQLIARITKHGWFDNEKKVFVFRDILDEVGKFLRVSYVHVHCTCTCTMVVTNWPIGDLNRRVCTCALGLWAVAYSVSYARWPVHYSPRDRGAPLVNISTVRHTL